MKKFIAMAMMLMSSITFASTQTIEANIKNKYPKTNITKIEESPIKGIYEVSMGRNIAYTDADARYFLFGHIFDMQTQQDLTAEKIKENEKIEWKSLNLKNALVSKKGDGSRVFALITDIDCPYSRMLEKELAQLDNYTAYKFLAPLKGAEADSISIWCAKNPNAAYEARILEGKKPESKTCANPIKDNLEMVDKLGITGTPLLIKPNGKMQYGAVSKAELEEFLK